jgi:hypothetical protein
MKRRDFFKKTAKQALTAGLVPLSGIAAAGDLSAVEKSSVTHEFPNGEKSGVPKRDKTLDYDVAVIGGGMAGMCAAVSAARNGANTVLVQDRSVLGGNASSEIRVHVNGVTHLKGGQPERETGVIEELLLHNRFNNPQESFPVFDHVLYDFISAEPNLDLLLNTQAVKAEMENDKIMSAKCWQQTTETTITIKADIFIDCSGDGLLAATAGAIYRTGREGKAEFGEKYAPDEPDGWQMGASLLLEASDMGKPMPFEAPSFTIPFDAKKAHKGRKFNNYQDGIWWIEVGSDGDIIGEFEENRHKLMGYAYGLWDYIKNSGDFPESENQALDWVCSMPGRRESRRFMGDYILKEPDMLGFKQFEDVVAYGGWSLDEHNPGGIEDLEAPPSFFHEHFTRVYQIPYRSLYSKNVPNLLFAGRNISQTHIALSSSRVMATCSTMGQAAGTAAAICITEGCGPRDVYEKHLNRLQEQLLRDDAFLPDRPAKDETDLARSADLVIGSSTSSGNAELLTDGWSRDFLGVTHHWASDGLPANVQLEWQVPITLSRIEIKCDTNVHRNILMRKDSKVTKTFTNSVPEELMKSLNVEARVKGKWVPLGELEKNKRRLIKFGFPAQRTTAIRINLESTYGASNAKLFEVRCYA